VSLARIRTQLVLELRLLARNGESMLLLAAIPLLLLVFFSQVDVLPTDGADPIDFLTPGILALAIMSTAMVNLAIATGFEREYGVLKRLGATPLSRAELLTAKVGTVLVVEAVQIGVLIGVAIALGWEVPPGAAVLLVAAPLATLGFVGIGLVLAGRLRGLTALAAANALYLVLLVISGMVIPLDELPIAVQMASELLPSTALTEILHGSMRDGIDVPAKAWVVLVAWAVVAPTIAVRAFRWEPSR
jgi:ABC-2 type transport system permease protein